ncbi:DUF4382 domain-containing protein [Winogradskyella sp. DF17]|uniref:DUF4382 domain-containing protein n=1 Tax=Winogradskyella pelagia TaxID=2819984 RepID=A0ABS3SY44_9FLAO|nr:DUF4382 domain-containing protein [Winogradskyella sp. DF17]MBO3115408.1 DUF4382 domain-containing protein [Winogradskyella sp. DF17]
MKLYKLVLSLTIVVLISACDDSNNSALNTPIEEGASLSIKLVDNPGDYENVFVEVIDVLIKYESDSADDNNGWLSIGIIEPGIYDLLELTGGVNLPLVENEIIETGIIQQIRLVLGDSNSIVLSGESEARPLTTPSAQQSGLKVMVNEPILPGFDYNFILDFDVDESIVVAGNSGNIILKPVLRANLEINSGNIEGVILPVGLAAEIEAANENTSATTFTNDQGNFQIAGLSEGVYTLTITPDVNSTFEPIVIDNVTVTAGDTTILETILFE